MDDLSIKITQSLANGAEYLAMGEIVANTGLLVSQAPRNNANFDVIVSSHDLEQSCRVEVKHSRSGFKANIKGTDFDVLVFIFHPCRIENNKIIYEDKSVRKIYIFPKQVVIDNIIGKTGTNFNPNNIEGGCDQYLNEYAHIEHECK